MKKVMILGAGLMQKPAIMAAKKLGYEAYVADANPNAVCVPLADHFEAIDLKDRDALVLFADRINEEGGKENGLAAVFTAGTDFSANVAFVAEHCGFKNHSYEACLNASDKVRMRGCFAGKNVPSPDFREVEKNELPVLFEKAQKGEIKFPKVVKPCDNMGGRGCRLVRNLKELDGAVTNAVNNSRTGRAIFEDYMEGAEFSIDSIVYDGTLTITGFADRHIFYPPYFIETGHTMPTQISEKMKNELIATFALGISALGLTHGVAKADIKYTKNGPMIGEIAARLSGGYMSGWTFPYSSAMNLTEEALKVSLGQKPDYLLANRRSVPWEPHESVRGMEQPFTLYEIQSDLVCTERAWMSIPGTIKEIYGLEKVTGNFGIRDVLPRSKAGDKVNFPRNNVEKCGNVIAVGVDHNRAISYAHEAVSDITIRLEAHNSMTESFLRGEYAEDEEGFPPSAFTFAPGPEGIASFGVKGIIPAGAKTVPLIPENLAPLADAVEDWNHCTLRKTLEKYDQICPDHPQLDGETFWNAVLRGGIQGALYITDCLN